MSKCRGSWPERRLLWVTNFRNGWCRIPFTVAAILSQTRIGFGNDPCGLDGVYWSARDMVGFELYAERKDLGAFWRVYDLITLHELRFWTTPIAKRIGYRIYRWRKGAR